MESYKIVLTKNSKLPLKKSKWGNLTKEEANFKLNQAKGDAGIDYNLGLVLGDDIVVIDVDVKKEHRGRESIRELSDKIDYNLEDDVCVQTPSGGWHIYYKLPNRVKVSTNRNFRDGIDIQAKGCYCVIPPSATPEGKYEKVIEGDEFKTIPSQLLKILDTYTSKSKLKKDNLDLEYSIEDIKGQLNLIDGGDYQSWVSVALSLKNWSSGIDSFNLFLEWSKKQDKYKSEEDTKYQWNRIDSKASDNPRTIRSIFFDAGKIDHILGGYNGIEVQRIQRNLERDNNYKNAIALAVETLPEEHSDYFCDYVKKSYNISSTEINRVKKDTIHPLVQNYIYRNDNLTRPYFNIITGVSYNKEAFNINEGGRHKIKSVKGTPISPSTFVADKIKVAISEIFDVNNKDRIVYKDGNNYINMYVYAIEKMPLPAPHYENEKTKEYIDRLFEVLCNNSKDKVNVLKSFCAKIAQNPGTPIGWGPIIVSTQGIGKTTLANLISSSVAEENCFTVDKQSLANRFNSWLDGKLFIVFEEISASGYDKDSVFEKLKILCNDNNIMVERKGKEAAMKANSANWLGFSNNKENLPIERNDRRVYYIENTIVSPMDEIKNHDEFFAVLKDIYKNYPADCAKYFFDCEIDESVFSCGRAPLTPEKKVYLAERYESGSSDLLEFIEDLMSDNNKISKYINDNVCFTLPLFEMIKVSGNNSFYDMKPLVLSNMLQSSPLFLTSRYKEKFEYINSTGKRRRTNILYNSNKINVEDVERLAREWRAGGHTIIDEISEDNIDNFDIL